MYVANLFLYIMIFLCSLNFIILLCLYVLPLIFSILFFILHYVTYFMHMLFLQRILYYKLFAMAILLT